MTVRGLLVLAAVLAAIVATILGFCWFGTDGGDWPGWLALAVLLSLLADLDFAGRPIRRGGPPPPRG